MLTSEQADILCDVIDAGTDGTWPHVRDHLLEIGWTPEQVVAAVEALAEIAGRSPQFEIEDFEV